MKCHNCGSDQHRIREPQPQALLPPKSQPQALLAPGAPPAPAMVPAGSPARGSSYAGYSFLHNADT
eukprot:14809617-Heterocapsa_arctica.AAC.1